MMAAGVLLAMHLAMPLAAEEFARESAPGGSPGRTALGEVTRDGASWPPTSRQHAKDTTGPDPCSAFPWTASVRGEAGPWSMRRDPSGDPSGALPHDGQPPFVVQIVVTGLRHDPERAEAVWKTWVRDARGIAPPPVYATAVLREGGKGSEGEWTSADDALDNLDPPLSSGVNTVSDAHLRVPRRCPEGAPRPCLGVPTDRTPPTWPPLIEWRTLHVQLAKMASDARDADCPTPHAWALVDDDALLDVPRLVTATRRAFTRRHAQTRADAEGEGDAEDDGGHPGVPARRERRRREGSAPPPHPTAFYGGFAKVSKFRTFDGAPVEWCDGPLVVFNPDGLRHVAAALWREGGDGIALGSRHGHVDLMVGNVARQQGIACTPLTGAMCQPKFQAAARKSGCSPVSDGDVIRHLILHGLVGEDLVKAHETLKRLRIAAGAHPDGSGEGERTVYDVDEKIANGDGPPNQAARIHGAGTESMGGLPIEPVEREARAAAARERRLSAESFAARRVWQARRSALVQTVAGAGAGALAFFGALALGGVRARPQRELLAYG